MSDIELNAVKYPVQPDYVIESDHDPVLAGASYKVNPDIQGNHFNTVDIDLNNKDVVDALNEAYPQAWANMYKDGSNYTYTAQNAYKLKRAVELYRWLHPEDEGISNVVNNSFTGELETTHQDKDTYRVQVPYSEFMTNSKWSEYRIPLDVIYSKDFLADASNEAPVPHYYDEKGLAVEIVSVEISDQPKSDAHNTSFPVITPEGETKILYVSYVTDSGHYAPISIPIFTPFLLESVRRIRSKLGKGFEHPLIRPESEQFVDGEGWRGFSEEYLNRRSHQVFHVAPKSPYDAGGEFAAGKYGFPN